MVFHTRSRRKKWNWVYFLQICTHHSRHAYQEKVSRCTMCIEWICHSQKCFNWFMGGYSTWLSWVSYSSYFFLLILLIFQFCLFFSSECSKPVIFTIKMFITPIFLICKTLICLIFYLLYSGIGVLFKNKLKKKNELAVIIFWVGVCCPCRECVPPHYSGDERKRTATFCRRKQSAQQETLKDVGGGRTHT